MAQPVGRTLSSWHDRATLVVVALIVLATISCGPANPPDPGPASGPPLAAPTDPPPTPAAAAPPAPTITASSGPTPPATPPHTPAAAATQPASDAAFSGERARQDVEQLAVTIGSRVAGSPAQAQAVDYLTQQFAAAGLPVDRQRFTFTSYEDHGSTLNVLAPEQLSPKATTLTNSPAGRVHGNLVYVDLARPGDFDPDAVRGRLALAKRGETRFSDKLANLAAAGASAVLIFNNQPGSFSGSLVGPGEIPAAGLSQEDGERLVALLDRGQVSAELAVDAEIAERQGTNLVATRPGGPREIVVGAHFDSVSVGPGANDNGSGSALLLELARATAAHNYPFTLRFVAFDAEERGLFGSKNYVRQLSGSGQGLLLAMINLDMVGVGERLAFGGDDDLVARALQRASDAGQVGGRLTDGPGSSSDHASFQAAGLRTIFVHRARDPRYHTPDDRVEYVLAENLAAAGTVVLGLFDDLADEVRRGGG